MKITKEHGAACLATMREIAENGETSRVERGLTSAALEAIGWLDRDPEDYFDYDAGDKYAERQVLTALAWCVTISEVLK